MMQANINEIMNEWDSYPEWLLKALDENWIEVNEECNAWRISAKGLAAIHSELMPHMALNTEAAFDFRRFQFAGDVCEAIANCLVEDNKPALQIYAGIASQAVVILRQEMNALAAEQLPSISPAPPNG